eukprot:TRINITY_DN3842_c0_g1_i2.p1 TRINITY_DN3842_c0_g1~~TRINITY_DN3842_c0_g1_i2.p1  ORF type:complete len:607 (-),score=103.14 TRINITY_DN3842_c0_g1_i2:1282-2958(-)
MDIHRMMWKSSAMIKRLVNRHQPKYLFLVIDGPGPVAKMPIQYSRRTKKELSCHLTPGSRVLVDFEKVFIRHLMILVENDNLFKDIRIVFSPSFVPGEGDFKIANYVRNFKNRKETCLINSTDSDLFLFSTTFSGMAVAQQKTASILKYHNVETWRSNIKNLIECDKDINEDLFFLSLLCGNDYTSKVTGVSLITLWGRYIGLRKSGKWVHRKLFWRSIQQNKFHGTIDLEMLWDVIGYKPNKPLTKHFQFGDINLSIHSSSLKFTVHQLLNAIYPEHHLEYYLEKQKFTCVLSNHHTILYKGEGDSKGKAFESVCNQVIHSDSHFMRDIKDVLSESDYKELCKVIEDSKGMMYQSQKLTEFKQALDVDHSEEKSHEDGDADNALSFLKDTLWVFNYSAGTQPDYFYKKRTTSVQISDFHALMKREKSRIIIKTEIDGKLPLAPFPFSMQVIPADKWSTSLMPQMYKEIESISCTVDGYNKFENNELEEKFAAMKEKRAFRNYKNYFQFGDPLLIYRKKEKAFIRKFDMQKRYYSRRNYKTSFSGTIGNSIKLLKRFI